MYKKHVSRTNYGIKNISELNWSSLNKVDQLPKDVAEPMLEKFKQPIVLPQVLALLASAQFRLSTAEGKFHFGNSLKAWADSWDSGNKFYFDDGTELAKEAFAGILSFLRCTPRGLALPEKATQLSKDWVRYSTPVPLYLSAFKQYRNIKYSQWDLKDPKLVVCTDFRNYRVLQYIGTELSWTKEELLELREQARTIKTGAKAGTLRTLNQTITIYTLDDDDFNDLPDNLKLMLLQTWLYQPGHYTEFGLYNLNDPDSPADPLINAEVFSVCHKDRTVTNSMPSDTSHLDW